MDGNGWPPGSLEGDRRAVVQYLETFSARFASERSASRVAVPPAREKNTPCWTRAAVSIAMPTAPSVTGSWARETDHRPPV